MKVEKCGLKVAERYLDLRGLKVLDRSWECPAGEADLVTKEATTRSYFVIVETRTFIERGFPRESTGCEVPCSLREYRLLLLVRVP